MKIFDIGDVVIVNLNGKTFYFWEDGTVTLNNNHEFSIYDTYEEAIEKTKSYELYKEIFPHLIKMNLK